MQQIIFTLCSNNYLAHAKTLGDSVIKNSPSFKFIIGLVDEFHPDIDYTSFKGMEFIKYDELGFPGFKDMIRKYNIIEFNTAVKPFYIEYLFNKYPSAVQIYYIDPDIELFDNFDELENTLRKNSIVLTPMFTIPSPIVTTDELVALRHGMYNLGFIGLQRSSHAEQFVDWWKTRLATHCVIDKPRGLFVDQKWVDLAPMLFDGIFILKDPGYNMAWWNFAERTLVLNGDKIFVNSTDTPLVFFHFSGFKPGGNTYTGRLNHPDYLFENRLELKSIFDSYTDKLYANRYDYFHSLKPLIIFGTERGLKNTMKERLKKKFKNLFRGLVK